MDSLSQALLGATLAEVTVGKKIGRSALFLGAALGTLPDLDVLIRYTDAVASFTYHRSWSHSLFVLTVASLPIAWVLNTLYSKRSRRGAALPSYRLWLLCTWLVLFTHPLLDAFTIYGTQLLWPIRTDPFAWGSLFIIDPLYTVPLLIAVIVALRNRMHASFAAATALLGSTAYIGVTLLSQQHAKAIAETSLAEQSLAADKLLIAPSPFSVLWRIVSMDGDRYFEGFYSVFDNDKAIAFTAYPRQKELIDEHYERWTVERLDWFTNGFIGAATQDDRLIIRDLRMGVESSYVFRFDVGSLNNTDHETVSELLPLQLNTNRMRALVKRVVDENVAIPTDE